MTKLSLEKHVMISRNSMSDLGDSISDDKMARLLAILR